jgi:hypothetical protein
MNVPGVRRLPNVPAAKLSAFETFKLWFAMNRKPVGSAILAMSTLVRVFLTFQGHTEVADTMKAIADLLMGTGAALAASGTFHSDDYHEEKANAEIGMRSGRFPAYQRRSTDKPRGDR